MKYGPLMSLQLGCRRVLVISSAKMAREALKTHDLVSSRPSVTGQRKLSYNGRDVAFSAYNSYWREMRKICVLHRFSQKRVQSFQPLLEDEVSHFIQKITKLASSSQQVNINAVAMTLSSAVICRVAFGKRYDENGHEKKRFKELFSESQAMLAGFFFSDYFPSLSWVDKLTGIVARLERIFKELDSFYQELIEEHLDPNRPQMMKGDIIDLLIQLKEDQNSQFDITWDDIKAVLMVPWTHPLWSKLFFRIPICFYTISHVIVFFLLK
jgi:cytochrome P450